MARILCIDDELEMVSLQKIILIHAGHDVATALDASSAYAIITTWAPDVILLDLMMPDIDGWEIYQRLREDEVTRHVRVIIVTARSHATERTIALQIQQVDDYLIKPFAPQQLVEAVEAALKRKTRR